MTSAESEELARKLARLMEVDGIERMHVFSADEVQELRLVIALGPENLRRLVDFLKRADALAWWSKWAFYLIVSTGAVAANWHRIIAMFTNGEK